MTTERLATVTLVVPDYDTGIAFFVEQLGFILVEDTDMGGGKRWVVLSPSGGGAQLLLAKAANESQTGAIGNQSGGRVAFFLETDDFADAHARFVAADVTFLEEPRHEPYGTVAVFSDPFGNRWDLLQRKEPA
ncbi:MAG: VOC family protein [Pseudomonadota bacterium]